MTKKTNRELKSELASIQARTDQRQAAQNVDDKHWNIIQRILTRRQLKKLIGIPNAVVCEGRFFRFIKTQPSLNVRERTP